MYETDRSAAMGQLNVAGMGGVLMKNEHHERMQKLTVRDNIEQQIAAAKAEVERLEGVRDRMAPELLDQRIMDLRQAMQF